MNILFLTAHFGLIRNFDSGIRTLAERGHSVFVAAQRKESLGGEALMECLARDYPQLVRYGWAPNPKTGPWFALGRALRLALDYIRYLGPVFANSRKLKRRAEEQVPAAVRRLCSIPLLRSKFGLGLVATLLRLMERAVPVSSEIDQFIRGHNPDVLLVTPLLYFGSPQVDFVRSAMALGIPTALGTGSWDHLTTKGLIHVIPDRVFVWNGAQKEEAIELHGVPADRVVVTGAHTYDHWFRWKPRPRDEFCKVVGLDPSRPYLLYLGSSPFIAPDEPRFVRKWLAHIRTSDTVLRTVGVLIRPHPQNGTGWSDEGISEFNDVRVWPPAGANPVDSEAKADYFDSIFHSVAAVGVNTSGLIEAGIVGRPVYTILAPEFSETQEGTLHFHHLVRVNGGLLYVAESMDAHIAQIEKLLNGHPEEGQKSRRFVEAFIRPFGIEVPAAPMLVEAIEQLGHVQGSNTTASFHHSLLRPLLYPLALLAEHALKEEYVRRRDVKKSKKKRKQVA